MKLHIAVGIFSTEERAKLNDPLAMRALLEQAVTAGEFTLFELSVVHFEPQGVTAAAVVGESHLALHTWPEEGRFFIDIASCGPPEGVERALACLVEGLRAKPQSVQRHELG